MRFDDANWQRKKLSDVATVVGGGTPSTSEKSYWNGNIVWLSPTDLPPIGTIAHIQDSAKRITQTGLDASAAVLLPKGSVVFSSRASIGKVGICDVELATNQGFVNFICGSELLPKYLAYVLVKLTPKIESMSHSTTFKEVSRKSLKNLEIPIPPIDEQKHIVSFLDQANALRQKRKEAMKLLDEYVQSGFLEMFGDPVINPKGWRTEQLGELAQVKIGPFGSLLHKEDYVTDGIPLVNPKHMIHKRIQIDPNCTITPSKKIELGQYCLKDGDVILGRRGEIGRCAIVTNAEDGYLCGTGSMFIRPTQSLDSTFLVYLFSTPQISSELENRAVGITMKNLNAAIVKKLSIPIPSLELQQKFARIVKSKTCVEHQMSEQAEELDRQFSALMQKAFAGSM